MSTTATPPATVPVSSVIPFPTPWAASPPVPGCCPPGGGMSNLNQCYWEIQQAQAFLSAMIVDLMNNDPKVQAATVAALLKSGLPVPTIGVTNGVAAPAGQVGEVYQLTVPNLPYGTVYTTQLVNLGIMSPGDWLVWVSVDTFSAGAAQVVTGTLAPLPTGFGALTLGGQGAAQGTTVVSKPVQALLSVATLVQAQIGLQGSASGTCSCNILALRIR